MATGVASFIPESHDLCQYWSHTCIHARSIYRRDIECLEDGCRSRGDPSVRAQLFEQQRAPSLFDESIDQLHVIVKELLDTQRRIPYQAPLLILPADLLVARDPFCYEKFVRETVLEAGIADRFPDADYAGRVSLLNAGEIEPALGEFKRLRLTDETIYLRNAAVNLINGMINMSFSCDGTHYIDHKTFFSKLENFETPT